MGSAKRMLEELQERGFNIDENIIVCVDCFDDYAIKKFIEKNDIGARCSYCETSGETSCSLKVVFDYIVQCINTEWGDPNNEGLPYESREGGWQLEPVYDAWDLLDEIELGIDNIELHKEIVSSLCDHEWCKREPYSLAEHEILAHGWKGFSNFVKTEARYVFLDAAPDTYDEDQHDEMHPVKILNALSEMAEGLGFIETLKKTIKIYRARIVDTDVILTTASELGSPPLEKATIPNRMSPAGISMFYGAFDSEISILETYQSAPSGDKKANSPKDKKAVVAKFCPIRDLTILDLSKELEIPSLFDIEKQSDRIWARFLVGFMKDFTKQISRNDRSHVEYVPTQIVTEYFRHIFRTNDGIKLDGIKYRSSKYPDYAAVVIFANNDQCIDKGQDVAEVSKYSEESILRLDGFKDEKLTEDRIKQMQSEKRRH